MKAIHIILFSLLWQCILLHGQSDTTSGIETNFRFKGQSSSWLHYNPNNPYPLNAGTRYIPQINYALGYQQNKLIDFELSTNIYGDVGVHFFDSARADGDLRPYRAWGRYSTDQLEVRIGLQKIDFGTAVMLRALRWFDQIDPRDPLKLTDGVYGGLMRYYFLNNANIWIWGLYGNKNQKGTELVKTNYHIPEFGGRIQMPIPYGETGISYHHRFADSRDISPILHANDMISENRIGIDAKWDLIVGLWFEGSLTQKSENLGVFTNQEVFTLGSDYTFGLGSGLGITLEHMLYASDENAFQFKNTTNNTGLSVMYPIGMFDNIQAIVYYNWEEQLLYNFINWYRSFDRTTFYVMAYWNPDSEAVPTAGAAENLYSGKGIQLMFVFNH